MNRVALLCLSTLLLGCSALQSPAPGPHAAIEPYLGVYRGSFDSALTEDPDDDLNHNTCRPGVDDPCPASQQPLDGILLALRRASNGAVTLAFFRDADDVAAGRPLDLLGAACGTTLGPLESLGPADGGAAHLIATFPLTAENRMCLGKLRPVSDHRVELRLAGADAGAPSVEVVIDKNVRDDNYLYVVEDGVQRRVRIDLTGSLEEDPQKRYRVCVEDDLGEFERCVLTDREFRSFALPLPVPGGGVGVNYTWWQELTPKLRRTSGRYVVEQYVGRFVPADS